MAYSRVKNLIEQTVASGLIYLNSHASDFKNGEIRPYLDRYLRGSNGYKAEERVKVLKLLWDCLGSEFGGRLPSGTDKRYNVYRNNVTVSLIDALAAIYPAIQRITGVDAFRAMG